MSVCSWPSFFFNLLFCLFICLLVCFPCVLSWKWLLLFIKRLKAWRSESQKNLSLPFCYPHLLPLSGYLVLLLFWQADLSSSHSSSSFSITHLSLSHSLILSLCHLAASILFTFVTREEDSESKQRSKFTVRFSPSSHRLVALVCEYLASTVH